MRSGTERVCYSSELVLTGAEHGPWVLGPGEHITAVEQAAGAVMFLLVRVAFDCQLARDAFLGTSIAFYTSLGSIFSLKGMEAAEVLSRSALHRCTAAQHATRPSGPGASRCRAGGRSAACTSRRGSAERAALLFFAAKKVLIYMSREGSTIASVTTCPEVPTVSSGRVCESRCGSWFWCSKDGNMRACKTHGLLS